MPLHHVTRYANFVLHGGAACDAASLNEWLLGKLAPISEALRIYDGKSIPSKDDVEDSWSLGFYLASRVQF